jgi:hypothetical protein
MMKLKKKLYKMTKKNNKKKWRSNLNKKTNEKMDNFRLKSYIKTKT